MNATEAATLCRYVKACCPQQAIDEYTPTAWADLLGGIRLDDAREAVRNVVSRQPFVAPAEIIAEVKRIRAKRMSAHPLVTPPAHLSPREHRAWLADAQRRIGDGETITVDTPAPVAGNMSARIAALTEKKLEVPA